jgi:hypothetical protein
VDRILFEWAPSDHLRIVEAGSTRFQAGIVAQPLQCGANDVAMRLFCEGLSPCPRTRSFRRDDHVMLVFCFARRGQAGQTRFDTGSIIGVARQDRRVRGLLFHVPVS